MTETLLSNIPEYSVSSLAQALKRTVEEAYGQVRVRGELGRVVRAKSGHLYLDLKDENAVIDGVMWKGLAASLAFAPSEGLEVIAEGRLSTYPGRSKYQIIIDRLEPAGEGALMALLEARRKALAAEGLFDEARKKPLPFLPEAVGVVTSPTGAVIRDILHRLADRFPRRVIVWPVLVQGEGAANQIAAAIEGFNALPADGGAPRPDVLIVARGGGSVEDLWCFNEEVVVRAAAASAIPLISAVGHETDWTLIDFAADVRAPTPTGAAEIAVPVRRELLARIEQTGVRLTGAVSRALDRRGRDLRAAARALRRPEALIAEKRQRLDYAGQGLRFALSRRVERLGRRLDGAAARLRGGSLAREAREKRRRLDAALDRLGRLAQRASADRRARLDRLNARLEAAPVPLLRAWSMRLAHLNRRLDSVSYANVLSRGFALVRTADGALIRSAAQTRPGAAVTLTFADGQTPARIDGDKPAPKPNPAPPDQGRLF